MTEVDMLHALLLAAMAVAPLVTRRFLSGEPRIHDVLHLTAWLLTAVSLLAGIAWLSFTWLLFCLFGLGLFVERSLPLRSINQVAQAVPFVFGVVGALWIGCGANELGLLGYGTHFSYYAALHGHVLGWMLVGAIAVLATRAGRFRRFYLVAVFGCLGSFFLIAFGIDGVPVIKRVGVVGITLLVGTAQLLFLFERHGSAVARSFGLVSFLGLGFAMFLAWQHELRIPSTTALLGVRPMVSLHGVVNGLVVAPCMVLAIHVAFPRDPSSQRYGPASSSGAPSMMRR